MKTSDFIEETLAELDDQIRAIDNSKVMRAAAKKMEEKNKLMAARRALLGAGPRTTGGSGNRVTQDEVAAWFRANEGGHSVGDIAAAMGHSPEVVRGHLNRGRGERFLAKNGKWFLRDPEGGMNTEEDVEDDD